MMNKTKNILRKNLIVVSSLLVGIIVSIALHNYVLLEDQRKNDDEYRFTSSERLKTLQFEFQYRMAALSVLQGYVESQLKLDQLSLKTFAESSLTEFKLKALCFHFSNSDKTLSIGESQKLCSEFDVTETSKLLNAEKIEIMISRPLKDSRQFVGYVSIIFNLESLRVPPSLPTIEESLVIKNSSALTLQQYDLNGNLKVGAPLNDHKLKTLSYYDLITLDEVNLFYATAYDGDSASNGLRLTLLVLSLLTLAVSTFIGYFIQTLGRQKSFIEREVAERTEELSQFAYRTSHDLKSPLTTIKGLAKFALLDLRNGNTNEVVTNLERILLQAERLESLVSDILNIAKADLSDENLELLNLEEYFEKLTQSYSGETKALNLSFKLNISKNHGISLPKARLDQIFNNLITNSIKYRSPTRDPYILIQVSETADQLEIVFADNGIGIPQGRVPEVFKPFKRFHPRIADGNGLGLSIVKRNVDKLKGLIKLTTSELGTQFEISIPMTKELE